MSTYLFHIVEDKPERVLVEALQVEGLLAAGYCACIEDLDANTEGSDEDLSDEGDDSELEGEESESEDGDDSESDDIDGEELSLDEVKELAIAAGINVGRKGIKTLKKELGI